MLFGFAQSGNRSHFLRDISRTLYRVSFMNRKLVSMGRWGGLMIALISGLMMTGCQDWNAGKGGSGKKGASTGDDLFLKSNYAPLNEWLDETFEVEYRKMTLGLVFKKQPISGIQYEFRHISRESPLFSLQPSTISRREILRQIALFYHLRMTVAAINGKPAYVLVEGRAATSEFNPNDTGARSVPVLEL